MKRKAVPQKNVKRSKKAKFVKASTGAISKTMPSTSRTITKQFLRYTEYQNLDPGAGTTVRHVYRANDLFDPNFTGIGHQPRGFDEWMQLYKKFVVTKAKLTVHAKLLENLVGAIIGVTVATDAKTSADLRDYTEGRYTVYKVVNSENAVEVTQEFDLQNWKPTKIFSDEGVHGTASNSPTDVWYFNVFAANLQNGPDLGNIPLYVTIEYEATFFDPIEPIIS